MNYRSGIGYGIGIAVSLATGGGPALAQGNQTSPGAGQITISCWRGPLVQTIWDHPEAVFIDSLVAFGYSFPEASAIASRVCQDATLVGDDAGLVAATNAAISAQPPGTRR